MRYNRFEEEEGTDHGRKTEKERNMVQEKKKNREAKEAT
jgi:hypothetical protein